MSEADRGMRPWVCWALLAAGIPVAVLISGLPDLPGFRAKLVLLALAIVALAIGVVGNRPANRRPWLLMICGLALISCGDAVVLAMSADATIASNVPGDAWLTAVGGVVLLAAMFDGTRRTDGVDVGGMLDALLLAVAAWTLLWQLVMIPAGAPGWAGSGTEMAGGAQVLVFIALLGLMIQAVRNAPTGTRTSGVLLALAVAIGLAAFLVGAMRAASAGVAHYAGARAALGASAHLLAAAAALHPSMRTLSEPRRTRTVGFTPGRTIGVGLALTTPPVALLASMWRGTPLGATSLAVSWLILIPMVLVRLHLLGQGHDQARAHADATERRMRSLVAHTGDVLLLVERSPEGRIRYANPASLRVLGHEPDALIDTSVRALVLPEDHAALDHVLEGPGPLPRSADVRATRDGEARWMEVLGDVYEDEDGPALVVTLRDVTERKDVELRWVHAAHRDALTGLANRRGLEQHLEQAFARRAVDGARFGVLLCDLDGFKPINDTLGHNIGDRVLQHLAARFARCIRGGDVIGRLGGDEFLVICHGVDGTDRLDEVAGRLLAAAAQPVDVNGVSTTLGMSVGVAVSRADDGREGEGARDELLHRADVALYRAKRLGRGRAEWDERPDEPLAVTATR